MRCRMKNLPGFQKQCPAIHSPTTASKPGVARPPLGGVQIVEIGISILDRVIPCAPPDVKAFLIRVIHDFVCGTISFAQAHATFTAIAGTTEPIDRLNEIFSVPETPIPYTEAEEDGQAGATRRKMRIWSNYEDNRLLAAIYRYGADNWAPISKFVGNGRTRAQCAQRWMRGLNPRISKDTWGPNEDMRLMQLVEQFGEKAWTKIAGSMGNRSDVQCRYHYMQLTKDMSNLMKGKPMPVRPAFGRATPRFSLPQLSAGAGLPEGAPTAAQTIQRRASHFVIQRPPVQAVQRQVPPPASIESLLNH